MCGIVGLFDIHNKSDIDKQQLERMNQTQVHRGPNEGDLYTEPGEDEAMPDEEIDTEGSEPSATSDVAVDEIEEVTSDEDPGEDEVSQEDPEVDQSPHEESENPE